MKNHFTSALALLAILSFSFSLTVNAQNKMKIGKVSMDDLKMTVYKADSTAEAVILGEVFNLNIQYTNGVGSQLVYTFHRRIKILHEDAIDDWGNVSFKLYGKNGNYEKLGVFKGYTINLENGKVVQEKLGLKDGFKEKASEYRTTQKFTFKNVQVGSIIDYSYKIYSDFFSNIPDLYFQYSIPVVWSEVTFEYPNYYQYKYYMTGSEPVYHRNSKNSTETVGNYRIEKTRDYWVFKDVPALKQLSYMRPARNYRTKINYELYAVSVPGQVYRKYSTSWEEINKDMMNSDYFGALLKRLGPTKEIAEYLDVNEATDNEKIFAAVNHIQSKFSWNGRMGVYPSNEWRKNLKEKKGNAPELNFALIGILKNLGIKAYPVILSTRANGLIFENFPATEDFNYIITAIDIDGKYVLVDPTSEFTGLNILPEYCLNGKGLLIKKEGYKWVPLEVGLPYDISEFVSFKLDEDLNVTADYQAKYSNYAGYYLRDAVSDKGGEDKYIEEAIENNKDYGISDYSFTNLNNLSKPVIKKYTVNPEEYLQEMGDLYLMKPILFPNYDENPFKKDKRKFPVDFTYPRNYAQTVMIELPEGYVFDETPKNSRVSTSDRSLYMTIMYSVTGNKLTMQMKFNIKKSMFLANRYEEIKSFFENVVAKENEQVIIREL